MANQCLSDCFDGALEPFIGDQCEIQTRSAGIDRVVFAKCSIEFEEGTGVGSIYDLDAWQSKIEAGDIVVTGQVLGSKAKGSTTTQKLASCRPEQVVSCSKSIQFADANATATLGEYDAYEAVRKNYPQLIFGYTACEDLWYGFFGNFTPDIDDVRAESNEEAMVFDGTLTYLDCEIRKPLIIPGLSALFASVTQAAS